MPDDIDLMARQDAAHTGALVLRTGIAVGMHHRELAKVFGVSRRTVSRWSKDGTRLSHAHAVALAELAHTREPALAAEIAALVGETLVTLGLEAPPPTGPAALGAATLSSKLVDAVVCAAAEAMDVSPRAVRPALLAALRSAREVGLTMEALEATLGGTE
jgi:hypothetical protein